MRICNFLPGYLVQYTLIFIAPAIRVSNRAFILFLQVNIALIATSVPDSQPTIDLCRRELWVTCQAYSMAATRIAANCLCVCLTSWIVQHSRDCPNDALHLSEIIPHSGNTVCVTVCTYLRRLKSDRKRKHNATWKSRSITHFKSCVWV
jgi:predicted deacetylase